MEEQQRRSFGRFFFSFRRWWRAEAETGERWSQARAAVVAVVVEAREAGSSAGESASSKHASIEE